MQTLLDRLGIGSPWELLAVILALAYVILAAKKSQWCWLAAVISSIIYVVLMVESRLYMESALNVFYAVMAVYGYWQWRRGTDATGEVNTRRWATSAHVIVLGLIASLTATNGWLLASHTDAARPYTDSFVTWSSVIVTWMVVQRIVENWLYWIVIDSVAAILYFQQGREPTGVLFVVYVAIAVHGFIVWRRGATAAAIVDVRPSGAG